MASENEFGMVRTALYKVVRLADAQFGSPWQTPRSVPIRPRLRRKPFPALVRSLADVSDLVDQAG